jgi:uncharacterized membrane protein
MWPAAHAGQPGSMKRTRRTRLPARAKPYVWALGVVWALPAALAGLGYLLLPHEVGPGQCEGIGFGCTLTPADTLLVLAVLAAPVLLVVGVITCVVIAVVQHRRAASSVPR